MQSPEMIDRLSFDVDGLHAVTKIKMKGESLGAYYSQQSF